MHNIFSIHIDKIYRDDFFIKTLLVKWLIWCNDVKMCHSTIYILFTFRTVKSPKNFLISEQNNDLNNSLVYYLKRYLAQNVVYNTNYKWEILKNTSKILSLVY